MRKRSLSFFCARGGGGKDYCDLMMVWSEPHGDVRSLSEEKKITVGVNCMGNQFKRAAYRMVGKHVA